MIPMQNCNLHNLPENYQMKYCKPKWILFIRLFSSQIEAKDTMWTEDTMKLTYQALLIIWPFRLLPLPDLASAFICRRGWEGQDHWIRSRQVVSFFFFSAHWKHMGGKHHAHRVNNMPERSQQDLWSFCAASTSRKSTGTKQIRSEPSTSLMEWMCLFALAKSRTQWR